MSLEYYGHLYFDPNRHSLMLWESLVCYMSPVMANHQPWYDTVLFPFTGYAKTLLDFLIQHNSSTESNNKISFHVVSYSSLLVMISNLLISCICAHSSCYILHVKILNFKFQQIWFNILISTLFLIKQFEDQICLLSF